MNLRNGITLAAAVFGLAATAFGQSSDTPFQIKAFTNLTKDANPTITLSNSGANSTVAYPYQNGAICANVYVFSGATRALLACCSCKIQANGLASLNIRTDLLNIPSGPPGPPPAPTAAPTSAVVKLMATLNNGVCNASTVGSGNNVLAQGMLAWGTSFQGPGPDDGGRETTFTPSTLSAAELASLNTQCHNLAGSNPGACHSCTAGTNVNP